MKLFLTFISLIVVSKLSFAQIVANNDSLSGLTWTYSIGLNDVINVLSNDLLNGNPATTSNVVVTPTSSGPLTLNSDGSIDVEECLEGIYTLNYTICEAGNPSNCATAVCEILVLVTMLDYNGEMGPLSSAGNTPILVGNIFNDANDMIVLYQGDISQNGFPAPSYVDFSNYSVNFFPEPTNTFFYIEPNGDVFVNPGAESGIWIAYFTIDDNFNSWTSAGYGQITITIANDVELFNDFVESDNGVAGDASVMNVLNNDFFGGQSIFPFGFDDIVLTPVSSGPLSIDNQGVLSLAPLTPLGTYTISYEVCEIGPFAWSDSMGCMSAVASVSVVDILSGSTGISGKLFYDQNNNCNYENGEFGLSNMLVHFYDINNTLIGQVYSNPSGDYSVSLPPGSYTVTPVNILPLGTPCASTGSANVTINAGQMSLNNDFGFECSTTEFDTRVNSAARYGFVFPGQTHMLNVLTDFAVPYINTPCAANVPTISGNMTISITGPVQFVSPTVGSLAPDIINGNDLTYFISDFSLLTTNSFVLNLNLLTSAQVTDEIVVIATFSPTTVGDVNLLNNTLTYIYPVVNSYDPNMKEVSPLGDVLVGFEDELIYTIYFQNLGSAPAFNIKLTDTLSSNLNLETFEKMGTSHACDISIYGNEMTVMFPNIMLPDSTSNPEGSIGFFQYKIKPLPNLALGSSIENTAHIFFDFNPAVVTNTVVTNFIEEDENGIAELAMNGMKIYPNPTKGQFVVQLDASITGTVRCEIVDITGKIIDDSEMFISNGKIECNEKLDSGIYLIRITDTTKGQSYQGRISAE